MIRPSPGWAIPALAGPGSPGPGGPCPGGPGPSRPGGGGLALARSPGPGVPEPGPLPPARGRAGRVDAPTALAALEPVRAQMLASARQQADEVIADARERAAVTIAGARRRAEEQLAAAREAGRAQAAQGAATRRGQGRRQARSLVLAAQRRALGELRTQVLTAVTGLRDGPEYPALLGRLQALAQRNAGPGAAVVEDPAGGAIARAPGVVVDCSLPRLAEAAVDALGPEVSRLWSAGRS